MRKVIPHIKKTYIVFRIKPVEIGFTPEKIWCPSPSNDHRTEPYDIPCKIVIGNRITSQTGAKFTPLPFSVALIGKDKKVLLYIKAKKGWHLWNFVEFKATSSSIEVSVDLEGHTNPAKALKNISLFISPECNGENPMQMLSKATEILYPQVVKNKRNIPDWWLMPIYCGWGDQVATSLFMEGPGPETRALAYCTQGLYEKWISKLEEAGIPIGIVIIDAGWSPAGTLEPYKNQWPDLRGFIERQHKKNRKVLLWFATFLYEGLPDKWCIFAGKTKLVADPTNQEYRHFLKKQIFRLISSDKGCFDADGFKIDQLSYVPSERSLRSGEQCGRTYLLKKFKGDLKIKGKGWGCELLYQLQKDIYTTAKKAKPDALINSSTVHPYFYDTFDMVRLHDTGTLPEGTVLEAMKARADLARAVLPYHPVDTDNWVYGNYEKWLEYTMNSYKIGIPCIFYSERFVLSFTKNPTTCEIPEIDLKKIVSIWERYIDNLKKMK
ncbi:MAG: hypothetical protein N3D17_00475 [bacterium]|nr:hypothetical protein [bacterium]